MPQLIHLCRFQFQDQDIRRVGMTTDGGTSLSGVSDVVETDGGGYWRADFTNGRTRTAADGLAWRALIDSLDGGAAVVNVLVCEKLFQPLDWRSPASHTLDPGAPDDPATSGTDYTAAASATLRATAIQIATADPTQIIPGLVFSIDHATWGSRLYRITALDGPTATIRPPLREAVASGTSLEFSSPRCQMRLAQATSNPTNVGRYTTCAAVFVEDMRKPS